MKCPGGSVPQRRPASGGAGSAGGRRTAERATRGVQTLRKRRSVRPEPTAPSSEADAEQDQRGQRERERVHVGARVEVRRGSPAARAPCRAGGGSPRASEPPSPQSSPSIMNGPRMNQFVAPTSFITSISRRREKIESRIVFAISSVAATSSTITSRSGRSTRSRARPGASGSSRLLARTRRSSTPGRQRLAGSRRSSSMCSAVLGRRPRASRAAGCTAGSATSSG